MGAFIAAISPIPDDIVYIPLGLAKYSPWKFAISTFTGKFLLNEMIVLGSAYLGKPAIDKLLTGSTSSLSLILITIASIIVLGIIIYISLKIDWGKVIGRWFPWALDEGNDP